VLLPLLQAAAAVVAVAVAAVAVAVACFRILDHWWMLLFGGPWRVCQDASLLVVGCRN